MGSLKKNYSCGHGYYCGFFVTVIFCFSFAPNHPAPADWFIKPTRDSGQSVSGQSISAHYHGLQKRLQFTAWICVIQKKRARNRMKLKYFFFFWRSCRRAGIEGFRGRQQRRASRGLVSSSPAPQDAVKADVPRNLHAIQAKVGNLRGPPSGPFLAAAPQSRLAARAGSLHGEERNYALGSVSSKPRVKGKPTIRRNARRSHSAWSHR